MLDKTTIEPPKGGAASDWVVGAVEGIALRALKAFEVEQKPFGKIRVTQITKIYFIKTNGDGTVKVRFQYGGTDVYIDVKPSRLEPRSKAAAS